MNNLNSILIEGNLVRDPLFRSTAKGTPLCTFSLASNRYYRQGQGQDANLEKEVSYFDVETWAKIAENCYHLGHKGRGVRVVGRLKQDRWTAQDGKGRSRVTIVAEHVEFRPDFRKEEIAEAPEDEAPATTTVEEVEAMHAEAVAEITPSIEDYEAVAF
jgi:single-strand DNA-binding protein